MQPDLSPVVVVAGAEYPPTLATPSVAGLLGCSEELLQQAAKADDLPAGLIVHRLGNRLRWSTTSVAAALGLPYEVRHVARPLPDPSAVLVNGTSSGAAPDGQNGERPAGKPGAAEDHHRVDQVNHECTAP